MPNDSKLLTIGFVLDDGLDKPDGVQQHILTLGNWFSSKGHEVHYLVGETARTDIANVHSMSRNLKTRFNGNTLSTPFPAKASRIKSVLGQADFDVLHVQIPYSPFMAARVLRRAGKQTARIGTFHILPVGGWEYRLTRILGIWLRPSLKRFDKFFSVSPPAADFSKSTFGIHSSVLPNPVDTARFKPAKTREHTDEAVLHIVFLGRLVARKGCLELLQAIDSLVNSQLVTKEIKVHICGGGQQRKKLEQFAANNNLGNIVSFHGFVSEAEKIAHLQNADIAVFPSVSGESFGIVLVEAMAAGAGVVLGGDNPGYRSVLADVPESLFDPENTPDFVEKLQKYIENHSERSSLHAKQQLLFPKFDVQRVGSELLKTYTNCINLRKSR